MPRRPITIIGLVLLTLIIAGVGGGWWWMAYGRFPFAGDTRQDFGEVPIIDGRCTLEHTFMLRNRRSEPVTVLRAVPSCGCTTVSLPEGPIPPGGTLELPITLNLSAAGHKGASIQLILEDESVQLLFVEAVGLRRERLTTSTSHVTLKKGEAVPITILFEVQDSGDEPEAPTIAPVAGVDVEFVRWELMKTADDQRHATKWRGLLRATLTADAPPRNTRLLIGVGEGAPVVVQFNGVP